MCDGCDAVTIKRSSRPHRKIRRFEDGWLREFCDSLSLWAAACSKYDCGKLMATPTFEDVAYAPQSEEGGRGFRRSRIPLGRARDIFAAEVRKVS